jgi:hypothetical protein
VHGRLRALATAFGVNVGSFAGAVDHVYIARVDEATAIVVMTYPGG